MGSNPTRGSSFSLGKVTVCLGCVVLLCLKNCCLFDLACFFLPSFSSSIKTCILHVHVCRKCICLTHANYNMYMYIHVHVHVALCVPWCEKTWREYCLSCPQVPVRNTRNTCYLITHTCTMYIHMCCLITHTCTCICTCIYMFS